MEKIDTIVQSDEEVLKILDEFYTLKDRDSRREIIVGSIFIGISIATILFLSYLLAFNG